MQLTLLLPFILLAQPKPVDFDNDVLPILTKAGCNAAACHGSAAGRGSFELSLYGGDPAADYDAIVRHYSGRRIHFDKPLRSLLLAKPTGEMEHGGDVRLDADGPHVKAIAQWIHDGARRNSNSPTLTKLLVSADKSFVESVPATVQLDAIAVYKNGTRRGVNDLAVFTPEDDTAVLVTETGKATLKRRGRHNVHVRFLTEVIAVTLTAPPHDEPIDLADTPRGNFIDDEIHTTLQQLRLPPSPPADPYTMLRRLRLDLTGRLPTPGELDQLDKQIARRLKTDTSASIDGSWVAESLIDELLASEDFTDYWTHQLGTWLRVGPAGSSRQNAESYHRWLRACVENNMPLDELAVQLITSNGSSGPANFYRAAPDARGQAEHFSEVLMGVRLRCANCHNHPLDRWTQDDYHGLAAMFVTLDRGKSIRYTGRGEVSHPATGEAAIPKLPGGEFLSAKGDHRRTLAQWLTSDENPHFARATANRLWAAMMGRGLVEPIDDFRSTNPPTHPALLKRLADDLIAHEYDLRHALRTIATSATYARSSLTTKKNQADRAFYSHAMRRPLSAEVLLDAIDDVTGLSADVSTRMVQLAGPVVPVQELAVLGQCDRKSGCDSMSVASSISRELALLNGDLLNRRIGSPQGRLARELETEESIDDKLRSLYALALSRRPTERERTYWRAQLHADTPREQRELFEDFLWSLLSCDEFTHRY